MDIHTDLTKDEAYEMMVAGHKISHEYYTDEEYLTIDKNGVIYDEKGIKMGTKNDSFWRKNQHWPNGWRTY